MALSLVPRHTLHIRPNGHPSFKNESAILGTVVSNAVSTKISEDMQIAHALSSQCIKDTIAKAIQDTMEPLTTNINYQVNRLEELKKSCTHPSPSRTPSSEQHLPRTVDEEKPRVFDNPTRYIEHHEENFLGDELGDELTKFLKTVDYAEINGRSVASYGEECHYTGQPGNNIKEIPQSIEKVIDLIHQEFKQFTSAPTINQVIINRYRDGSSCLPKHSDNEPEIKPDSQIFTVSLGSTRSLVFRDEHTNSDAEGRDKSLEVSAGSIYIMSQPSQFFWSHRMEAAEDTDLPERISLTFRTVGSNYKNSTAIIGDSNTKHLRFSSGKAKEKGTFGYLLPGKRVEAFHIRSINPEDCIGYQNVILHCGINDIRNRSPGRLHNDPDPEDINAHFENMKKKVQDIKALCPRIAIFLSPRYSPYKVNQPQ